MKVEVVIGTPQRGPYHLALRHANPGTFFVGELRWPVSSSGHVVCHRYYQLSLVLSVFGNI